MNPKSSQPINHLLNLMAAQLKLSQMETEHPIETLSSNFTELAEISNQLFTKSIDSDGSADDKQLYRQLQNKIQNSIIAFQFYDRLTQRLEHVLSHISAANNILNELEESDRDNWRAKLEELKKSYTMESERKVFDLIIQGKSVEHAIASVNEKPETTDNTDVELF